MCKMLLPFDNENMDGRRKIPYIWDNIPTHIKDLNVKWIIELYEQFSLANKKQENWKPHTPAWKEPQECMFCSNLIE